jgi:hypothetical protein
VRVVVLGSSANTTNVDLVRSWRGLGLEAELVPAVELERHVGSDVVVVARLDVLPSLNGVEPGLLELLWVERRARWWSTARVRCSPATTSSTRREYFVPRACPILVRLICDQVRSRRWSRRSS